MESADMTYRKSSYSTGGSTNCVEVGTAGAEVLVRDTTNRDGGTLIVSAGAWRDFLRAL